MSAAFDPELRLTLARAFDSAWNLYWVSGLDRMLAEDIARPELAKRLVAKAKQGVKDQEVLARYGLQHLISLARTSRIQSQSFSFRAVARARFVSQWRASVLKQPL